MQPQSISFDIRDGNGNPIAGVPTIRPSTALPTISATLTIDGSTQPGGFVELDGSLTGAGSHGVHLLNADSVILRGLVINRFPGSGVYIREGGWHVLQGNRIGFSADGGALSLNRTGAVRIEQGAPLATEDVTIGAAADDPDSAMNQLGGGVVVTGNTTRQVRLLRNRLEVPLTDLQGATMRLPIDIGDDGPSCAPWVASSQAAPNGNMAPPRVLSLPTSDGGAIQGLTRPGASVVAYRVLDSGSGHSRYWARRVEAIGIATANTQGAFSITPATPLAVGARIALHANDAEGNASELTQLRRPVIFLPGIGGTWLRDIDDSDLWIPLTFGSDEKNARMARLAMTPSGSASVETLQAPEVLEGVGPRRIVYGAVHDHFEAAGFSGHPFNAAPANQDLWRFPNDWRFSVDLLANNLRSLIARLTDDSTGAGDAARSCEVDVVAHSNGGMIASLYLRRDAAHARDRVHRFVTSGTPYLGSTQAMAAHTKGYVFEAEEKLGNVLLGGWDVAWGDMLQMIRNVPGAYGRMPSRAYYDAADPDSISHSLGYSIVDLSNLPMQGYDQTFDWLTFPKVIDGIEVGLARNAPIWQGQQQSVHEVMNDWRDYAGPPQVFRHVGLTFGMTATSWYMDRGPALIGPSETRRSEPGDTDRHRAFRERLVPYYGVGDHTVPLVSATLGRSPLVGRLDLSGVDESRWIEEFEYYDCEHSDLVKPDCMAFGSAGPQALDRLVAILNSGHQVLPAALSPTGLEASKATLGTGVLAEVFYVRANAPIAVVVTDAQGARSGPIYPDEPLAMAYEVPDVAYDASLLGAALSLLPERAYTIEVTSRHPAAVVYLTRQRVGAADVTQILYPDQPLPLNGRLRFTLEADGTPELAGWERDADANGVPETVVPPAAVLDGSSAAPAVPLPQPAIIDLRLPPGGAPTAVALRLPDTGTAGWSWQIKESAPWLSLSAASGPAPDEISVLVNPAGLPQGSVSTVMSLTLSNGGYSTTVPIPVTLRIGVSLPVKVFSDGFE